MFDGPAMHQTTFLMEYVVIRSLKEIADKERLAISSFDWDYIKKCIYLISTENAMKYFHKNGILYLDLKPKNKL